MGRLPTKCDMGGNITQQRTSHVTFDHCVACLFHGCTSSNGSFLFAEYYLGFNVQTSGSKLGSDWVWKVWELDRGQSNITTADSCTLSAVRIGNVCIELPNSPKQTKAILKEAIYVPDIAFT